MSHNLFIDTKTSKQIKNIEKVKKKSEINIICHAISAFNHAEAAPHHRRVTSLHQGMSTTPHHIKASSLYDEVIKIKLLKYAYYPQKPKSIKLITKTY